MQVLPSSIHSFADMTRQFDYDASLPLEWEEHGSELKNGIHITDVSYASPGHGRIRSNWVLPASPGQYPAIVFLHPAPGDRSTFLEEAILFAHQGMASLLVEAPWAQGEAWGQTMGEPGHDREEHTRTVLDLRRAVDGLVSRPEVIPGCLGFVGHSFGALFGGLLSGVEKRFRAFVLMAGIGSFSDLAAVNDPSLQGDSFKKYRQGLAPVDPIFYVGQAAPSALFFQFGRQDNFLPPEKMTEYADAASQPKLVRWYDTDHFFTNQVKAQNDRLEWLQAQISPP